MVSGPLQGCSLRPVLYNQCAIFLICLNVCNVRPLRPATVHYCISVSIPFNVIILRAATPSVEVLV